MENFLTNDQNEFDCKILCAFLQYIEEQMTLHPELIVEADEVQLERIAKLIEGVDDE